MWGGEEPRICTNDVVWSCWSEIHRPTRVRATSDAQFGGGKALSVALHTNFIGGEWIGSNDVTTDQNPSDLSDVIGEYARADERQASAAVSAAFAAAPAWGSGSVQERSELLDRVGTALLARSAEIGEVLSREEGKILRDGIAEVGRAGRIFKFFAGEALRLTGQKLPSVRPGVEVEISREPVGVVAIITPWNFPIAIPAWKIAPALAYGNTVVFKPAELVPGTAWELAKVIADAGIPPGVFNLVMGRGSVVGGGPSGKSRGRCNLIHRIGRNRSARCLPGNRTNGQGSA